MPTGSYGAGAMALMEPITEKQKTTLRTLLYEQCYDDEAYATMMSEIHDLTVHEAEKMIRQYA